MVEVRRHLKAILRWIFAICALPVLWIAGSLYQVSRNSLTRDVKDLQSFVRRMPTPMAVRRFEKDSQVFIEVVANRAQLPATPSGHATYVFDGEGNLVYWTIDSGDSISYW